MKPAGLARLPGAALRGRYRAARPYRHAVIDGFLEDSLARAVASELPGADDARFTEGSEGVSICRAPESFGPAFARLDSLLRSAEFIGWLESVCGVPGIRRNTEGSCGGLFRYEGESELDVHLDSNDVDVHCAQVGHRRKVNLLLYLSPGWRTEWGGEFDLYANPSRPPERSVAPLFNRCVLFDSHDRSWHGVAPISLPAGANGLARFALILNYYSTNPAGTRKAPPHYNILMPRPLPPRLRPGRVPELADLVEAVRLLKRRDARIDGLRALERASRTGRAPAAPPASAADPFALLDALPPGARPGRPLTRRALADLRRLFSRRDRELRRLYRGHYAAVQRLKSRAPELVPKGY